MTSNRLGQVVVPAVAGVIAGLGIGSVFLVLAALQATSVLVAYRALRDKK